MAILRYDGMHAFLDVGHGRDGDEIEKDFPGQREKWWRDKKGRSEALAGTRPRRTRPRKRLAKKPVVAMLLSLPIASSAAGAQTCS
jgi:hypothetical protein